MLHIAGAVQLNGGVLTLASNATPTAIDLTDPEYRGQGPDVRLRADQGGERDHRPGPGGTIGSAAGSMLVLRAPAGGSILLEQPGNTCSARFRR